jgi:hypothetical protein
MAGSRPRLTPRLLEKICSYIRAGACPEAAAEAAGVPGETFRQWMTQSELQRRGPLAGFRPAVLEAVATARVFAEAKVFDSNPLAWLKHGPGKETPERPGWTTSAKPCAPQHHPGADVDLTNPRLQQYFVMILQVLTPYPEARTAVAAALAEQKTDPEE